MTADPGYRGDADLRIAFDYTGTVAVGDRVEIAANRAVRRLTSIASPTEIGTVDTVRVSLTECVVLCDAQENRQDRIAGETVVPGRFVFGPENKVYQFRPAAPATVVGTTTGVQTIVLSTSDTIKVTPQYQAAQTITITAGVGRTMQSIADELNATPLVGMTAYVNSAGNLCLLADEIWKSITIGAVANDAYTLLGWTAQAYVPGSPSHDSSSVAGMILVGGDLGDAVETIEE